MSNSAVFLVIFAGTAFLAVLTDRIRFFARHELLTGLMLVGVALSAIVVRMALTAKGLSESALRTAVESTESDIDDQLGFAMLSNADLIAAKLASEDDLSPEAVADVAKQFGLDEINVVDASGMIVASNVRRTGVPFDFSASCAAYGDLLKRARRYVKERFSEDVANPDSVKYLGVTLPQGGFLQLGYKWTSFERDFYKYFIQMFEERRVCDTGFYLVANTNGCIALSVAGHPEANGRMVTDIGLKTEDLTRLGEALFLSRVFGRWCLCEPYMRIGEWKGFAILPLADIVYPATGTAGFAAAILIIFCVIFRLMLVKLRRAQAKIDALRDAEESRRTADLALARAIQRAELRTDGTEGDGYRIAALMNAAREVGGDFYDYYELPDGRLAVTVADVSGKGIPAAFFMMKARTTLKACVRTKPTLAEAVAEANVRLSRNNPAEMFVTAWVGVYDRKTGRLDFVSAGHNPPLVKRRDGAVAWLQAPRAAALGVFEKARYRGAEAALAPGDRLFLYTDGVTEAMDADGKLFGDARLEAALRTADGPLVLATEQAVRDFTTGAEQSDDITMLELGIETCVADGNGEEI